MKEIVIVKAGGTNFASIEDALERLHCKFFYAKSNADILNASKILLPGVGSMQNAQIEEFRSIFQTLKQPVLGICLGMQLLFEKSAECKEKLGLGVLKNEVVAFQSDVISPHTGWNNLKFTTQQSIFAESEGGFVYFTHSFFVPKMQHTTAFCNYGTNQVSAIIEKENFYGFQFHPEKSGLCGEKLLEKFLAI